MSKREAELKSLFTAELKRQLPGFYSLAYATNGAPDRSVVGAGRQSNWEMKHATPDFDSPGDQELMCCRLEAASHCRYVIWFEHKSVEKTMIVRPRHVIRIPSASSAHSARGLQVESWCVGFDMKWLVDEVRKVHGL
jgi:hypothetical protein